MTLKEAISIIEDVHPSRCEPKYVMMIEYEDGSLFKFNYRLIGETKNRFIDLRPHHIQLEKIRQKEALVGNLKMWTTTLFEEDISQKGIEHCTQRINEINQKLNNI